MSCVFQANFSSAACIAGQAQHEYLQQRTLQLQAAAAQQEAARPQKSFLQRHRADAHSLAAHACVLTLVLLGAPAVSVLCAVPLMPVHGSDALPSTNHLSAERPFRPCVAQMLHAEVYESNFRPPVIDRGSSTAMKCTVFWAQRLCVMQELPCGPGNICS